MKTVPPITSPDATTVLARLFADDGRITTHSQGLLLGRRIVGLIDAGSSVKVSLDGITEFRGPSVHAMMSEIFSTVGVYHADNKLVFTAEDPPESLDPFTLHMREAAANFREQEQQMDPQPIAKLVPMRNGKPGVVLTILPKPLAAKEPEAFGAPPVKNEVEEVLAKQGEPKSAWEAIAAARVQLLKERQEKASAVPKPAASIDTRNELADALPLRDADQKEFHVIAKVQGLPVERSHQIGKAYHDDRTDAAWEVWRRRTLLLASRTPRMSWEKRLVFFAIGMVIGTALTHLLAIVRF